MRRYKKMKKALIIVAIIVFGFIAIVFGVNNVPNKAIRYTEYITTAKSEIQVQEKRRADLLPNLVDAIKSYDKHEYDTLMAIVNGRNTNTDEAVNEIKTQIKAVAEAYPELKSSDNYRQYMKELSITENKIAQSRTSYNSFVTDYNSYCKSFPNRQILNLLGYTREEFPKLTFDVSDDAPTNLFD